jgi:formamidopyrimidine-DNA glycosylase
VLRLDTGTDVGYRDVRRFGTWTLLEPGEEAVYLRERLGPEPLAPSFTANRLGAILATRRAPVKAVLLDQRRLAGVGNIYADEALWRARVHPRREAGSLSVKEVARLHRAVRAALRRGVELQGSTLRDYVTPDGVEGAMQDEFHVYGRRGEPCDRCGTQIERIVVGGRGTWVCPRCQRAPGR